LIFFPQAQAVHDLAEQIGKKLAEAETMGIWICFALFFLTMKIIVACALKLCLDRKCLATKLVKQLVTQTFSCLVTSVVCV